jgi:hypothetical protein
MKLKDLEALGLTTARAEIIARAAALTPPNVSPWGLPGEPIKALVKHGFAEWVLEADESTQAALARTVAEYVKAADEALHREPPDWKHALALLNEADANHRDAARRVLRLTPKGLAFAAAWRARPGIGDNAGGEGRR